MSMDGTRLVSKYPDKIWWNEKTKSIFLRPRANVRLPPPPLKHSPVFTHDSMANINIFVLICNLLLSCNQLTKFMILYLWQTGKLHSFFFMKLWDEFHDIFLWLNDEFLNFSSHWLKHFLIYFMQLKDNFWVFYRKFCNFLQTALNR